MNDNDLIGTCDTCGTEYDAWSREGRCGDCGECRTHCTHTVDLPERINVTKVVTYVVADIVRDLQQASEEGAVVTRADVLDYIDGLVSEDFSCGFGHVADLTNVFYTDTNGNEF